MNDVKNTKEVVSSNIVWRLMERLGAQIVTFIVSIVLARLLDPSIYGQIALTTIFITIMNVFVDSGLGTALIQKKDADELDFSTVFFFNVFFCLLLYAILFFISPLIASFYNEQDLTSVLRVLGIIIIISGVKNIQISYVSRKMQFRKFFFATLGGTVLAAVVGIWMAVNGYGIWSLVVQTLLNNLIDTIILWLTVKWRPKFLFSFKRLRILFSYGWKLLLAKLFDTIYEDIRSLIIGKKYSASDLAYYNKAKQIPQLLVSTVNTATEGVMFSSLSKEQDDKKRLKHMTSKSIRLLVYLITPMMIGLAACSKQIINILLTSKWSQAVPYMQIFCFGFAIIPISLMHLNVIKAVGESALYLKLEIIRKVLGTIALLIAMWFGVKVIAISYLINCVVAFIVNSFPNRKLIDYKYSEQFKDLLPATVLAIAMGVCVYLVNIFNFSDWITLLIQVPFGIAIYIIGSMFFKLDGFKTIKGIIKNYLQKTKKINKA